MKANIPELEPFEPIVERLCDLAFQNGIHALAARSLTLESIKHDLSARRRFIRACHYGYDLAQRQAGRLVVQYEHTVRSHNDRLKELRRKRDPKESKKVLHVIAILRHRQLVLRRLIDSILYILVGRQTWVLRRIMIDDRVRAIDPNSLARTLEIATSRNTEDRMTFSLVSDLSTVVHVGDLVQIRTDGKHKGWEIIELKEGPINQKLSDMIEDRGEVLTEADLAQIKGELGEHASKQAARMVRQKQRQRELREIIDTDKGIDLQHHVPIVLHPEVVEVKEYSETLRRLCETAENTGYSVAEVDRCLRLLALTRQTLSTQGRDGVAHIFYHLQKAKGACRLDDPEGRRIELQSLHSIWPFFNLVQMNLQSGWAPPVFLWSMPHEMIMDLVMGRIFLFAQLDFDQLFELAKDKGIQLSWVIGRDADKLGKIAQFIPGSPRAKGVLAKLPGKADQILMTGFFARVFLEFMSPSQLVSLIPVGAQELKGSEPTVSTSES